MNKLILNFFGEEVTVETPKTLENLKQEISNKFLFSPSDVAELLVSYIKDLKKTFIKTEQDFLDFIKRNVYKVDLDISPDSQLFKKSILKLQEETEQNKKDLEELIKKKEELNKKKIELCDERAKVIKELGETIKEINRKRCKLIRETNKDKEKITGEINETNKKIVELQNKLGLPNTTEEIKKPVSAKVKTNQKKPLVKKIVKKNVNKKKEYKKKTIKKEKEKDLFTKVNETIEKMVQNITKLVSEQINKKTKEIENEKKKIEESKIQLKEEQIKGFFDFNLVSQNVSDEINKWVTFVAQQTNELTNSLSEKYKNCVNVLNSINKNEKLKTKKNGKLKAKAPIVPKLKVHSGVSCDGCGMNPIIGSRFKCSLCPNFDYCEKCEELNKDLHLHPFIKIYSPETAPINIKCELK